MRNANPPPSSGSLSTNRPVKRGSNRILERWFVAPAMFRADASLFRPVADADDSKSPSHH